MVRIYEGNDVLFKTACEIAGLKDNKITVRQFSKWKQGRGLAHSAKEEAKKRVARTQG